VLENAASQWGPLFNAPAAGVDYWNAGRVVENGGTLGSTITRVDLTASTVDHGDGKLFILQRYAMPRTEEQCTNFEFSGTIADSPTIPAGSTFSLVSAPIPAGQAFTFNPDGSYTYTPDPGYVGDVVFDYQVCLPAPNTEVCDASTVTITYKTEGCNHCSNSNADGPLLRN
jgi:Bacterial Ig domain